MASWGEAMTYHQTLWRNENLQAGRDALARLGPTPAARIARTSDPKEQGYLTAVESLFGDVDAITRARRYADAMGRLYTTYPDDPDVAAFYALALLGTMSRSLIGTADAHEGHSQALAGSATQAKVAPGSSSASCARIPIISARCTTCCTTTTIRSTRRRRWTPRAGSHLAPESSHTRHMPAHIFLQLGQWHDARASDRASFAASEAWIARKNFSPRC